MSLKKVAPIKPTVAFDVLEKIDIRVGTIEVVGEFLGLNTESNIFTHFCRYYSDWLSGLRVPPSQDKRLIFGR